MDFRARLRAQGAHRVFRGDSWYWVLKDPYVPGEDTVTTSLLARSYLEKALKWLKILDVVLSKEPGR